MWNRNYGAKPAIMLHRVFPTDDITQGLYADEALDRQLADRHDQLRSNDPQLTLQPVSAPRALGRRRNAISPAGGMRSRITARYRRYIEEAARSVFIEPRFGEPLEERAPRPAGKWTPASALRLPGRLANQHRPRRPR
jgi:hypothetical protein